MPTASRTGAAPHALPGGVRRALLATIVGAGILVVVGAHASSWTASALPAERLAGADAATPKACSPMSGMTCVAGGAFAVGDAAGARQGNPARQITLSTFYVDDHAATFGDYQRCVDAGACTQVGSPGFPRIRHARTDATSLASTPKGTAAPTPAKRKPSAAKAAGPDNAMARPLTWRQAQMYCAFVGKRLPSEWEWEAAARGPAIAARTDGPVWTDTWAGADASTCSNCTGTDPRGPCDGAFFCPAGTWRKIVRGARQEKEEAQPWTRRAVLLENTAPQSGVRCALTDPVLTRFPSRIGTQKRPVPAVPAAPSAEQLQLFSNVKPDALNKQECADKGRSFIDCRDPNSYIKSNEPREHVWRPYIENLGGGYTGVGIDQNYSLIAVARSEWAWLFDYDPTVVRLHGVLRALIIASPSRQAFVDQFKPESKDSALAIIESTYKSDPERAAFRELYAVARPKLLRYYVWQLAGNREDPTFGWLSTDDAYAYVRTLYQQGRILILKGDMLGKNAMQGIGAAARALHVPIRVYYPSNAPENWPHTPQYKANVQALPFDESSVVLQTLSGMDPGFGAQQGYWHYNVQQGLAQQALLKRAGYTFLKQLVFERVKTDDPDLTLSGLAAAP